MERARPREVEGELRALICRPLHALLAAALLIQGCANYKTTLQFPSGQSAKEAATGSLAAGDPRFVLPPGTELGDKAVMTLPRPKREEAVVSGDPRVPNPTGWVQLRFDVDVDGKVTDLSVVRSSDPSLEFAARQLLSSWSFEPATVDGDPVPFEDMEVVMGFSETTTAGEVVGTGALVVILLPLALLALAIGAMAGMSGSIK